VLIPEALLKAAICLGCNDSISRVGTQYSSLKDMTVAEFGGGCLYGGNSVFQVPDKVLKEMS